MWSWRLTLTSKLAWLASFVALEGRWDSRLDAWNLELIWWLPLLVSSCSHLAAIVCFVKA